MMPRFSESSRLRLASCHPALIDLFETVIEEYDATVIEGHRGQEAQHAAFIGGKSQLDWPKGKHNRMPSLAVDVAPAPIDWGEKGTPAEREKARARFYHFAGYVLGVARCKGITVRWGGDWARDFDPRDNRFADLVHFELVEEPPTPVLARHEEIA